MSCPPNPAAARRRPLLVTMTLHIVAYALVAGVALRFGPSAGDAGEHLPGPVVRAAASTDDPAPTRAGTASQVIGPAVADYGSRNDEAARAAVDALRTELAHLRADLPGGAGTEAGSARLTAAARHALTALRADLGANRDLMVRAVEVALRDEDVRAVLRPDGDEADRAAEIITTDAPGVEEDSAKTLWAALILAGDERTIAGRVATLAEKTVRAAAADADTWDDVERRLIDGPGGLEPRLVGFRREVRQAARTALWTTIYEDHRPTA